MSSLINKAYKQGQRKWKKKKGKKKKKRMNGTVQNIPVPYQL